jgi:16S rRNA (cytosine1402-N4)-methyltransferase
MTQNTFHKSVLVNEVITYLNPQPNKTYIDATFGGGGHTRAILDAQPQCSVIAIDWDTKAIEQNAPAMEEAYGERFRIVWGNFAHLYKILKKEKIERFDGILADFGTSQFQIHQRPGFSFQTDTELDMRMSPAHQLTTAATLLNNSTENALVAIFSEYGQEPRSKQIAHAIVQERQQHPFVTTDQLVQLIHRIYRPQAYKAQHGIDPATRVFQALRIAVNAELDNIKTVLAASLKFLAPQGRMVFISFHSLEDRLVKNFFRDNIAQLEILTSKPITASQAELNLNPSSRSAKLRAAVKL